MGLGTGVAGATVVEKSPLRRPRGRTIPNVPFWKSFSYPVKKEDGRGRVSCTNLQGEEIEQIVPDRSLSEAQEGWRSQEKRPAGARHLRVSDKGNTKNTVRMVEKERKRKKGR